MQLLVPFSVGPPVCFCLSVLFSSAPPCLLFLDYLTTFISFKMYLFVSEREGESVCTRKWGRSRVRGRERERILSRIHIQCTAQCGLNLMTLRLWSEPRSRVRHLTDWASQVPQTQSLLMREIHPIWKITIYFLKFIRPAYAIVLDKCDHNVRGKKELYENQVRD